MKVCITTVDKIPEHCCDCCCHNAENGYCQADPLRRTSEWRPFWCPLMIESDIVAEEIKVL